MEKLERIPDDKRYYDESDFVKEVIEKINMIIDHLNSQDQEGYEKRIRIRGELSGETEHIKAHKEYLATSKQDTPEEWEKRFKEIAERYYEDGSWVDIDSLVGFIKQLLKEREREVLRGLLDDHYDPNSDSIEIDVSEIQSELSKLTTK